MGRLTPVVYSSLSCNSLRYTSVVLVSLLASVCLSCRLSPVVFLLSICLSVVLHRSPNFSRLSLFVLLPIVNPSAVFPLSFVRLSYNTSRLSFCRITPIVRTSVVFLLSPSSSFRLFSCRLLDVVYSSVVYPSVVYPSFVLLLLSSACRLTSVLSLPVVQLNCQPSVCCLTAVDRLTVVIYCNSCRLYVCRPTIAVCACLPNGSFHGSSLLFSFFVC
jgi:hypothetical protein